MSEPDPLSPEPFDLSEAAVKQLYLEREDEDVAIAQLLAEGDGPAEGDRPAKGDLDAPSVGGDLPLPVALATTPLRAPPREPTRSRGKPPGGAKRGGKVAAVGLGVCALLVLGWAGHRPAQTPRAADAAKRPPTTAGLLRVADLAAGRKINPGESYGVDLPVGKVRVAVMAGEVRLASKDGESLRACSNQPFVVDAAPGPANPAPLITACGKEPAFVQAEIPPPPLPAPAPGAVISPSTLRAGGD